MIERSEELKPDEGISFRRLEGEIPPPGEVKEGAPEEIPPEEGRQPLPGKIPLQPAFIRLVVRMPGEAGVFITKWEGWRLDERVINDIVEVWVALGIETSPWMQALILPMFAYGEKFAEYQLWRRAGRPGHPETVVGSTPPQWKEKKE